MNILILNGSPAGEDSITLQTMEYLKVFFTEHTYTTLHVGRQIRSMEKDFTESRRVLEAADLILFCYPVYTFLVPAQLHRFIELIKEHEVDLAGKYASQISTSKHFYDITAHRFIEDICADLHLQYVRGLSADMEDILTKKGQKEAKDFFRFLMWNIRNGFCETPIRGGDESFSCTRAGDFCVGEEASCAGEEVSCIGAAASCVREEVSSTGTTASCGGEKARRMPHIASDAPATRVKNKLHVALVTDCDPAELKDLPDRAASATAENTAASSDRAASATAETMAAPSDRAASAAADPLAAPSDRAASATAETTAAPSDRAASAAPETSAAPSTLAAMIRRFEQRLPGTCEIVNLREFPFQGGCLGCFHCASDGVCIYKDGFDEFLRQHINSADAVVYAYTIKDHSMGYRFKLYDDRQFCNGHRTVTMGKPVGYLVDGDLAVEENLRLLMESRAQVGGNFLAGIASDQSDPNAEIDRLVKTLVYAVQHKYNQPKNFYGVGGLKIFRDLIFQMQGLMKEDHRFYKEHGFYDFPQKKAGRIAGMYLVSAMMNNQKLRSKMKFSMTDGMMMAYRKVIEQAKKEARK